MSGERFEIGRLAGAAAGPTLIVIGGIHGNEPAGVEAARRVLEGLRRAAPPLRGDLVAFAANPEALAAGRRYLARDLNRQWTPDRVAAARALAGGGDAEERALARLAGALDAVIAGSRGPVYALDLHTTSADGAPFAIVGAGAGERAFAARFPLSGVVGLGETLEGVLVRWLATRGCVAQAVEGGQHASGAAAANLEAVVTLGLAAAGLVAPAALPGAEEARARLAQARGDLPPLIEVISRHQVHPERAFRMEPGFANLQRTAAGTLLAREDGAEIRAPFDGLLLLPLYQPQGSDGFFYGRELAPL